jgi:septum formation protein
MEVVLASRSPRRREILQSIGLRFTAVDPETDFAPDYAQPVDREEAIGYACDAARAKGESYAGTHPAAVVISADTIVYAERRIYGKPASLDKARATLRELYERTHTVITGLALHNRGECRCKAECTEVTFGSLTPQEEDIYMGRAEIMDKAGSYAIQGVGGVLVRGIRGDYFNVVGMPLNLLDRLLKEAKLPGLLDLVNQDGDH